MKSAVALLLTSVVFAQEGVLETCEPTIFEQYAKEINEEAPFVQLTDRTFSNHSDSGYVAIQQDVYMESNRTFAYWEGLMRAGIVQSITSEYYEGAHTVLLVNSIAEWESGPANNFTITTSGNSHAPTNQSELQKNEFFNQEFWVNFGGLSENVTAYDGVGGAAGQCVNVGQGFNEVVNYVNKFSNSQVISLFYGPNCDNRVLQVWVDPWQDILFTGTGFSSIIVNYGSLSAP